MSYILDALKKSEKERTRKRRPGVGALGNDVPVASPPGPRSIIILVLIIAVTNAAAIYWLFDDPEDSAPVPDPTHVKSGQMPAITADTSAVESTEPQEKSAILADKTAQEAPTINTGTHQRQSETGRTPPPMLDITAHIFANEPDLRMVRINGVARREGDRLEDNHILLEITEQGVVLSYDGERYSLNVVEDWQIN